MNIRTNLVSLTVALATSALSSFALPSMASAADLPPAAAPASYTKAPMVSPATNWSGFYGGVNVGYGWGNGNVNLSDASPAGIEGTLLQSISLSDHSSGVIGGGQIGYNWQVGTFVTGLEADIQGSSIRGTTRGNTLRLVDPPLTVPVSSDERISWFGTVRGRLGVTVTPDFLLYGTGGLAYGGVRNSADAVVPDAGDGSFAQFFDFPSSASSTKIGWAAGAGGEWMFARNWSAKVEYLHVDLGKQSAVGLAGGDSIGNPIGEGYTWRNSFDTVRAGVNYHFN